MFSQYRDIPSIQIPTTCVPKNFGNVVEDGNCLYRSVSLLISGTRDNQKAQRNACYRISLTSKEFHSYR